MARLVEVGAVPRVVTEVSVVTVAMVKLALVWKPCCRYVYHRHLQHSALISQTDAHVKPGLHGCDKLRHTQHTPD